MSKKINELPAYIAEDISNDKLMFIGDPDGTLHKIQIAYLKNVFGNFHEFEETNDTAVSIPADVVLDYILIVPQFFDDMTISIGTTEGGHELVEEYFIANADPQPIVLNKYFKAATTLYISGFNQSCIIKIKYK